MGSHSRNDVDDRHRNSGHVEVAYIHLDPMQPVAVHFLGTCSGGGPIQSRNCSSLAVDFGNDIWLFDCADGTLARLMQSPLRVANITRIFITHMHADHVLGLVWVLTHIMSGIGTTPEDTEDLKAKGLGKKANFHIYGPAGLRQLVRTSLMLTEVTLSGVFAVHELLHEGAKASVGCGEGDLHANEAAGMDIMADGDEVWRSVLDEGAGPNKKGWSVQAGPIEHRVPAIGYILKEPTPRKPLNTAVLIPLLKSNAEALAALNPPIKHCLSLLSTIQSLPPPDPITLPSGDILHPPEPSGIPPRKLVIFGDCSGGTKNPKFQSMCEDPSLLVHECTNSMIPELIQRGKKGQAVRTRDLEPSLAEKHGTLRNVNEVERLDSDTKARRLREEAKVEEVRKKAIGRGHSTPVEVGTFARDIRARRLVINHFSCMFPSPRFASSDSYPSILSETSPFPNPVPYPLRPPYDHVKPLNLHSSELHIRLILQAIASQVDLIWNECRTDTASSGHATVPARDFMIMQVPGHDLTGWEQDRIHQHLKETTEVSAAWQDWGGVYVPAGKGGKWIGLDPEPKASDKPHR